MTNQHDRSGPGDRDSRTEQMLHDWHRELADGVRIPPALRLDIDRIPEVVPASRQTLSHTPSRRMVLILAVALLAALLASIAIAGMGRPFRPSISDDHWEVLAIGDQWIDSAGWPSRLAALMSGDLGIMVTASSQTCMGDCGGTKGPLNAILGSATVQDEIRAADVILVQPQPGWVVLPALRAYFLDRCGGDDNRDCLRQAVADYRVYTGQLLDELSSLSGPETLLRVVPSDAQVIRHWRPGSLTGGAIDETYDLQAEDPESFAVVISWFHDLMGAAMQAAADRCVPVWDSNAYFSDSNYDSPPPSQYFDGFALTPDGELVVANHVHGLGYWPRLEGCESTGG